MTKVDKKELLIKAKEEIAFLENQQFKIYDTLCKSLKTKDFEGFVWDYLYNGEWNELTVLKEIDTIKK